MQPDSFLEHNIHTDCVSQRRVRGSNPRYPEGTLVFETSSFDHSDNSPFMSTGRCRKDNLQTDKKLPEKRFQHIPPGSGKKEYGNEKQKAFRTFHENFPGSRGSTKHATFRVQLVMTASITLRIISVTSAPKNSEKRGLMEKTKVISIINNTTKALKNQGFPEHKFFSFSNPDSCS